MSVGRNKFFFFFFLLCVLLGLLVPGSPGSLFAELDEPPRGTEQADVKTQGQALQRAGEQFQGRGVSGEAAYDRGQEDRDALMVDQLRRGVLLSVSWIMLAVGFVLVALTLQKTYRWLLAAQNARVPPTRYFNLQLQVRSRDGDLGLHNFDYYPVVVAAGGSADLLLPDAADPRARFRIDYRHGQAHISSESSIIVNGVPRRQKPLKQDDRIIFGSHRLVFKDASIREQSAPIPGKPVFAWQFPIVALLLALSVLFKQAAAVPEDTMLLAKAAQLQEADQSAPLVSELSVESQDSAAADEPAPETMTLVQKLRWIFSSSGMEEVRLAEADGRRPKGQATQQPLSAPAVVQSPAAAVILERRPDQPADPKPSVQQNRSAEVATVETKVSESAGQGTRAQKPLAQKPAAVVSPKADAPAARTTKAEDTGLRETEAVRSTTPQRTVLRRPQSTRAKSSLSRQPPSPEQIAPARKPIVVKDPPVDAVAEIPAPRSVDAPAVRQEASSQAQRHASQQAPVLQASVLGTVAPAVVRNNGINPLEGLGFAKARSVPEIGRTKVRVIPPGRPVEYFKVDILFIHAHPDDESIDFGSLMAMASRSNKRIATLLFTDGESGLDLYPQRKVGDIYPARALTGGALSQVRVVEATRALSILGSETYIRWGLENRPYNTKRDEVSPDEVIRGWGGEDQLVARLIEVLEGFQPTIVVSPDGRSKAYEHFEHEAVGQLVQAALESLRRSGRSSVKGHLVSIDPYQVDSYSGVSTVDAQVQDGESGLAYRAIQALALKEHVSQRDASVIGVSRISHLPHEFYKALYWNLEQSLAEYLK